MAASLASERGLGRVIIIGGCGFLGHHVVRVVLRDWTTESVSVVDLRCERNRQAGVEYVETDITDATKLGQVFARLRPSVVIHTASPPAESATKTSHELFHRVNVVGTQTVIAACQEHSVQALVYTSSASIISDNVNDLVNANEEWPVIRGKNQTSYYTETKAQAEADVLGANRTGPSTLLTAAIRPSGIFGEGDVQVIYHMVNLYEQGRTGWQIGGDNPFDFTYAENVAHGHLLAARALLVTHANPSGIVPLNHERVDGEAFFITNAEPVYFWDFTRAVWRAAGSEKGIDHIWHLSRDTGYMLGFLSECFYWLIGKPPTLNRTRAIFASMTRYYDITKAKARLGYKPLVNMNDSIKKTVTWTIEDRKAKRTGGGGSEKK